MNTNDLREDARKINRKISWASEHIPALDTLTDILIIRAYTAGLQRAEDIVRYHKHIGDCWDDDCGVPFERNEIVEEIALAIKEEIL